MNTLPRMLLLVSVLLSAGCAHEPEIPSDPPSFSLLLTNEKGMFFKATIQKKHTDEILVTLEYPKDDSNPKSLIVSATEDELNRFESAFSSLGFWRMDQYAPPYALDGNAWILEASKAGVIKKISRLNPEAADEEKKFMKLARMFLDLDKRYRPAKRG